MSMQNKKKWLIILLKGFEKQPVIEKNAAFSFSFLIDFCKSIFSLLLSKRL